MCVRRSFQYFGRGGRHGQKNQKVTGVISNLTEGQARRIKMEIIASKQQIAPKARGGFIAGHEKNVGMIMTRICNKIGIGGS